MIISTGIDIVELDRVASILKRSPEGFLNHVYTASERAAAPQAEGPRVAYFGSRWAVKEAVAKALGTGVGSQCGWTDIDVFNLPSGAPQVRLSGAAAETAQRLGIQSIHISISHERHYAVAMAIAERKDAGR